MSTVSVDDLLSQITQYGSNVEFDASVSRLHAAAQVIATSLLPAQRLEPTMNRLSQDGAQLESELAASSASVGDAEARLLRSSYDNETMQERNALQVRYRQDLDALRRNCEERMGAVSEYASQLNMAGIRHQRNRPPSARCATRCEPVVLLPRSCDAPTAPGHARGERSSAKNH